jgi:type IV fimbrial biogenesis protein FimT
MNARQAGMTLVELMVALAVAIVLMAIGIPAFQNLQITNRAAAQVNGFVTALNLARAEAVGRGVPVSVCAKSTETDCDAGGNWLNGWLVFTDPAGAGACDNCDPADASGDEVVRSFGAPLGQVGFTGAPAFFRFNSRGERIDGGAESFLLVPSTTTTCSGGRPENRRIRVLGSGQITTTREACT